MDFETEMLSLNTELFQAYGRMDMTQEMFDQVVERTGNFREGFYSSKRFRDLGRSAIKNLQQAQAGMDTQDGVLAILRQAIQDINNITATMMTEIDRIDG